MVLAKVGKGQDLCTDQLDDRVARKQVGGREQIEGKKSEVTEDE